MATHIPTIPAESFSGEQLCRVSMDMSDEDIILTIQSKLGNNSTIKLFRHDDVILYGIMDDRQILLGMPFADRLGWNLEKPCQEWERCTFEGTRLMKLNLCSLDLTELPSELGHLTNLQKMWCRYNRLTELPSELGQLTNLQKLWCYDNQLTELPSELGNLTKLQTLECSSNKLTALPSELGNLTNLQQLWCSHNRLTELPSELGQLTNLQTFWCYDNELGDLPPEILALRDHGCTIHQ